MITPPSSTTAHNQKLDQRIVDRDAIDWSDPWRMRKHCVTLLSTMKNLFVLRSDKRKQAAELRDPDKK